MKEEIKGKGGERSDFCVIVNVGDYKMGCPEPYSQGDPWRARVAAGIV